LLKKEYRKAILYFNKSLEFKPNYSPALNNIGVMYREMGDDQKAEVAFDSATKSSPYAKTPRFNLAQIYLEYGLSGNARTHLNVLVKAGGDSTVYNSMAISYLMENNLKLAGKYFSKVNHDDLEKPEFGINYALYLIRIKQLEKAEDVISDIEIDNKSKYFRAYTKLQKEVR
jgi:Flp pilus assembly protein TadD